jgi:hypothetical protein
MCAKRYFSRVRRHRFSASIIAGLVCLAVTVTALSAEEDPLSGPALYKDVRTYAVHPEHRTGTNMAYETSDWMKKTLDESGFETEYQRWLMKQYLLSTSRLTVDGSDVECFPMWFPKSTGAQPIEAPLVAFEPGADAEWKDKIVFVKAKQFGLLKDRVVPMVVKAGARALVISGDSPSSELAVPDSSSLYARGPMPITTVFIGKRDEVELLLAAKKDLEAKLDVNGRTIPTAAGRNLIGKLSHGDGLIVVSTSYTGWFRSVGEQGTGVALFLGLAKWAGARKSGPSYLFVAFGGSELGNTGFNEFMRRGAPDPKDVICWVHLGPSAAARAWDQKPEVAVPLQELSPGVKLESCSDLAPALAGAFEEVFKLTPGKPAGIMLAKQLVDKGYKACALGGDHFYRGTKSDAQPTTSPAFLVPLASALKEFLTDVEANSVK